MMPVDSCKVFERISNAPFTARGIRPGGLDLTRQLLARSKLSAGARILDVGCGTGVTVDYLSRDYAIRAVGIDTSSMLVSQGKGRNAGLPLLIGCAEALPFSDGSFDGVLLECTLSLVQDRERVISECRRVLRPLGKLMVTDVYARNPEAIGALRTLAGQSCLKGALDKDQLIHDCSVEGFVMDCFEDHSEMLKDFAVQIIWTYGSLDEFWAETETRNHGPEPARCAIRDARPGYFLYLGSKAGVLTEAKGKRDQR
ncbi:MAG: methyltransferase domain-containing protein [Deltaproteobacteria bacterium]|nr:methyltransferase domain-containing protein [Deltaproteobacteria bacterium]